ncbi:aminotransferase class I/II-fold pyridoxal phosphate-dependent enzyme, partial [Candidatus Woesearchaeota archaeon]|nr:aminotransferase class I/II-fold pyridoxal phosphate-dependent enzyme [Candidatus Woesearchaeota archaeon]
PTGQLYKREELEAIAEICRKHNVFIIADEIYVLTTFEFNNFTSMGLIYPEGTFITNGISKDRSAGGYRLGYCILPKDSSEELKDSFRKIAAIVYTNVSTPIQYAGITAYQDHEELKQYYHNIRNIHRIVGTYFSEQLNNIPGLNATMPEGTFYLFLQFKDKSKLKSKTSNELENELMNNKIAAVTGDACLLKKDDFGARMAFVEYNGQEALTNYQNNPPKTKEEEIKFVKNNCPKIIQGIEALRSLLK